jgi:hypothetical protein
VNRFESAMICSAVNAPSSVLLGVPMSVVAMVSLFLS